jgi:hypothetical protein
VTLDEQSRVMSSIEHHAVALQSYIGSEAHTHMVGLLNALIESYKLDLIEVDVADLVRVQSALRQVLAINKAVQGVGPAIPRI